MSVIQVSQSPGIENMDSTNSSTNISTSPSMSVSIRNVVDGDDSASLMQTNNDNCTGTVNVVNKNGSNEDNTTMPTNKSGITAERPKALDLSCIGRMDSAEKTAYITSIVEDIQRFIIKTSEMATAGVLSDENVEPLNRVLRTIIKTELEDREEARHIEKKKLKRMNIEIKDSIERVKKLNKAIKKARYVSKRKMQESDDRVRKIQTESREARHRIESLGSEASHH
jgi:hypothetical protein